MVFLVGFELVKHQILEMVIKEFLTRGLDVTYAKEIAEWKKYIDQKKFAVKLDKQMKTEIKRFRKTIKKWKPGELVEFVIEGVNQLPIEKDGLK